MSSTANTDSYVYDSAGCLIQATVKGQTETYAYDAFGNMTAKGIAGGASTTIPVDGSSNRLIGPSYDAAGNVLSRDGKEAYEYDSFNMLSVYRSPALQTYTRQMVYDADDERLGVLIDAVASRWSVRDLDGQVIREFDGERNGNTLFFLWQGDFVRGEGGQLLAGETPVWQYVNQNGTATQYGGRRQYHLDHLGSVRLVTDSLKRTLGEHDYYPYGVTPTKAYQEELGPAPHIDPMRYAGHQRDFLGYLNVENTDYLDYMHARYYDPKLGRFLTVDPLLDIKKATRQPQNWNRYAYVMNNPLNRVDPDGRDDGMVGITVMQNCQLHGCQPDWEEDRKVASFGLSSMPYIGDVYDGISSLTGRDYLGNEEVGTFARIAGLLPLLGTGAVNRAMKAVNLPSWKGVGIDIAHIVARPHRMACKPASALASS